MVIQLDDGKSDASSGMAMDGGTLELGAGLKCVTVGHGIFEGFSPRLAKILKKVLVRVAKILKWTVMNPPAATPC